MKKVFLISILVFLASALLISQPVKRVVVEEGTGTWCGWCPLGMLSSNRMHNDYGDKVIFIAIHAFDDMELTDYLSNCSFPGYPSANIDRVEKGILFSDDDDGNIVDNWYDLAGEMIEQPAIAEISVTTEYDQENKQVSVNVSAEFFEDVEGDYRLMAVLCEDAVTGGSPDYDQSNYLSGGVYGEMGGFGSLPEKIYSNTIAYDHVARELMGTYYGEEGSLPGILKKGDIYNYTFTFDIQEGWNENYLYAACMLISPDTTILNAGKSKYISGSENAKPIFLSDPITSGIVDNIYSYNAYAYDPDNEDLTITAIKLPEWLELKGNIENGIIHTKAILSGVPTEVGKYEVVLNLSDGNTDVEQTYEIDVQMPPNKDWTLVGESSFTPKNTDINDMVFDNFGNSYLLISDQTQEGKLGIYKHSPEGSWEALNDIVLDAGAFPNIDIDSEGMLYIAYRFSKQVYVKKWDGTELQDVGDPLPDGVYLDFALNHKDTPYLAMTDYSAGYVGKAYRFNGSEWELLGDSAFTGESRTYIMKIDFDFEDNFYVLWTDDSNNSVPMLSKYYSEKSVFGDKLVQNYGVNGYMSLAFSNDDMPVVAYQRAIGSKIMVYKYDGFLFYIIGDNVADGPVDNMCMSKTESGNLIVTYLDINYNFTISSMIYDGNSWEYLGKRGFSESESSSPMIAVYGEVPYVCYKTEEGSGSVTVKKYGDIEVSVDNKTVENNISIYPNPVNDKANIEINNPNNEQISIIISDLLGYEVQRYMKVSSDKYVNFQFSVIDLPQGIYFVKIYKGNEIFVRKIIK
jgi:hypothetical protein